MKRRVTLTITTIIVIFLASCGDANKKQGTKMNAPAEIEAKKESSPEIADASFSDEVSGKVFYDYQQIRIALVNSDAEEVNLAAGNLAESFTGESDEIKSMAIAMLDTKDIEKQRTLFSELTEKVEPLFKETISEGAIYKQFCPMAFDGKGGYWISDVEEIRNPYYGEKMLKCGKVTETIKK
ncbi:DUF3347 domain-containing protein [uncultured Eudoraea sp.]|uniref:DUF3347 domain-containing protein n=1 Tax=uncultured Eudoraea sp. TaxID=1035614 RepID=UPI002609044C|nr:DUF3347 domain-containing protein [uncultured Eudoraea sp.]